MPEGRLSETLAQDELEAGLGRQSRPEPGPKREGRAWEWEQQQNHWPGGPSEGKAEGVSCKVRASYTGPRMGTLLCVYVWTDPARGPHTWCALPPEQGPGTQPPLDPIQTLGRIAMDPVYAWTPDGTRAGAHGPESQVPAHTQKGMSLQFCHLVAVCPGPFT